MNDVKDKQDEQANARSGSVAMAGSEIGVGDGGRFQVGDETRVDNRISVNENNITNWVQHLAEQFVGMDERLDLLRSQIEDAVRTATGVSDFVSHTIAPRNLDIRKVVYGNGEEGLLQRIHNLERQIAALRDEIGALKNRMSVLLWAVLASPPLTILFLRFLGVIRNGDD
jgi:hypothetical protein